MKDYPYTQDDEEQEYLENIVKDIMNYHDEKTEHLTDDQKEYIKFSIYDYLG